MRHSIATVCLSGSLEEKMSAAAVAGFDGIEIFEPDLVVSELSPEEIRARAVRLGLTLDLYQPFRDFEGVTSELLSENLRRAEQRFHVMRRLGIDTLLVCSNVATATLDSDEVSSGQLRQLGDLAASYDVRVAFEALAWGRYVDDYRRAWRIVEMADHPAVGTCLDSFHILSRGHDPSFIESIPGEKVFFVQLADAPRLSMDVLSWSRHHRLFPGEGDFDLVSFVGHLMATGYDGPLSLEVFNDIFRRADPCGTAEHALRSLVWLEDQSARASRAPALTRIPEVHQPTGFDFVEVKAEDTSAVETVLDQLGLAFRGQHRTKAVRLWSSGEVRIVLNEQHAREQTPVLAGVGVQVPDTVVAAARAHALGIRRAPRRTQEGEQRLVGFEEPSGMEIFVNNATGEPAWSAEFEHGHADHRRTFSHVDHVNLIHGWSQHDGAVLFFTSLLGLAAPTATQLAGPEGLVRSQVMRSDDGSVRIPMNVAPGETDSYAEHVALACDDIVSVAAAARANGLAFLEIPDNYYDDLRARLGLPETELAELRQHHLLYDRDDHGIFRHFYTPTVGGLFFEVVERRAGYDGYGAVNAPVRLAAQARQGRSPRRQRVRS
ncbi:MAG TPA: TIM barrel protein [Ornithinimicrobium sp.]|uniref:bifunctional sugar phosphate isomerase/epimerase/4-hydroxyphenylpyruvate dioxygenase family protein n=1 Tax=Ornithinimicrobium sp. TaxID=1977084 RepID=UPI002B46AC42|nr:TIM barrel protein [Ornithinimicrobium sp.]HKJ10811.1 TIM barrel protein [Ornithinimicrobium sp.]